MQRYIHPNAVLDIADQSYFADVEVEAAQCFIDATNYVSLTGRVVKLPPHDAISVRLTFPDDKSLMAFELSFDGPFTVTEPRTHHAGNNFAVHLDKSNYPIRVIRDHISELQAEARRSKINTTEEELSAHTGRHEGD